MTLDSTLYRKLNRKCYKQGELIMSKLKQVIEIRHDTLHVKFYRELNFDFQSISTICIFSEMSF